MYSFVQGGHGFISKGRKRESLGKQNCWEFMKCGREMNGIKSTDMGVCPVCFEKQLDGVHGGKNAGRACWVVAGTMCAGKVHGSFAEKTGDCLRCDFFKSVQKEEGPTIVKITELLEKRRV